MRLVPVKLREAQAFVELYHRHNVAPRGWKFGVGLEDAQGGAIGVGIAGRPVAHAEDTGSTLEILRICTLGHRNAPSMLYGSLLRAGRALGYTRVITYTLQREPGSSLRAVGFTPEALLPARDGWDTPGRSRDNSRTNHEAKVRWVWRHTRDLTPSRAKEAIDA